MSESDLLNAIESKAIKYRPDDFELIVHRDAVRHDGDWTIVLVTTSDPEARASGYSHAVSKIEEDIEDELGEKVLLVPALVD